ncbi:MAG: M81 family metallopeptidase [Hyphomicrobiaceae bacterium]
MRIAVAGFQHETNTFAPLKADYQAFVQPKSYPPLITGDEMLARLQGKNLPASGAIQELQKNGAEIVPLLWCLATPSAHVTEDAYERITGEIMKRLAEAAPVDGLLLELHGAMVAEHIDDGEGEFLRRIRERFGRDLVISIPLDLHANVTRTMIEHADYLDMYRHYPHTDMAETGKRAAQGLLRILETGKRPAKAFRQLDFLIPINGGCTEFDTARGIYLDLMPRLERETDSLWGLSFAAGFPHADFHDCGPSVMALADTQAAADKAAETLAQAVADREADFLPEFYSATDAVSRALAIARDAAKPVVIADTQDNPGGGGPGDTTGLLRAMMEAGASNCVIGAMIDPETAKRAHDLGEGRLGDFEIGGKRYPGDTPVATRARVLRARSDGWIASGPMWGGLETNLGLTALLETVPEGVLVAVASRPAQTADRSIFEHLGLKPGQLPVIAVKSSVHFRADFTPLAHTIIVAASPGPVAIDHTQLPYRHLRPGLRSMPRKRET